MISQCAFCTSDKGNMVCKNCRSASYCGVSCQRSHWKVHRISCKQKLPLQKLPSEKQGIVVVGEYHDQDEIRAKTVFFLKQKYGKVKVFYEDPLISEIAGIPVAPLEDLLIKPMSLSGRNTLLDRYLEETLPCQLTQLFYAINHLEIFIAGNLSFAVNMVTRVLDVLFNTHPSKRGVLLMNLPDAEIISKIFSEVGKELQDKASQDKASQDKASQDKASLAIFFSEKESCKAKALLATFYELFKDTVARMSSEDKSVFSKFSIPFREEEIETLIDTLSNKRHLVMMTTLIDSKDHDSVFVVIVGLTHVHRLSKRIKESGRFQILETFGN